MIGGIIMILVVLWVYHSAVQAKVDKVLFWVVVCAAVFLTVQFLAVQMNIYLLESLGMASRFNPSFVQEIKAI